MLEEVGEYVYRIDRALAQVTSSPAVRVAAGIRLGRCSDIPPNDPDFGRDEEAVAREWCMRSGIQWLGRADIGHDVANKVVRSEEHTSELQSLMRSSYAVFCLKKKTKINTT